MQRLIEVPLTLTCFVAMHHKKRKKETGVAGGVVPQKGFLDAFHVKDKKQVSSVVVAILQALALSAEWLSSCDSLADANDSSRPL